MDGLTEGVGKLFTDPDPDNAREFFRKKSRKMVSKLMPLKKAINRFANDGDYLLTGGFGANRTPIAACHELVRQGKKNMALAGHTTTHDFQILAAGKVFNRVDAAYIVGLEARGLSKVARNYMESGEVEVSEWTNYALAARLKAAVMGVSFVPVRCMMGTDTFKYSAAKIMECPFTGVKYTLLPALYPDISIIHVHESDIYGNCRFKGVVTADLDAARAGKHVIITAERIVDVEDFRNDPSSTLIPYYLVDAVCEVPFGAYPGNMAGEYFSDEEHLQEWLTVEKDPEAFKEFLEKNIFNCETHYDYIRRNGGMEKMLDLRRKELLIKEDHLNGNNVEKAEER